MSIVKSASWQFATTALAVAIVPLGIRVLGEEGYGKWLVLLGLVNTLAAFDFGIANSARNVLARAVARNQKHKVKVVVSTLYVLGCTSAVIAIAFGLIFHAARFSASVFGNGSIFLDVVLVGICAVGIDMVAKLSHVLCFSNQRPDLPPVVSTISGLTTLCLLWLIHRYSLFAEHRPAAYCIVVFTPQVFFNAALTAILFARGYYARGDLRPSILSFEMRHAKLMLQLGSLFFCIQVFMAVSVQIVNVFIVQHHGGTAVTDFAIVEKIYGAISVFAAFVLFPLWSKYTALGSRGEWGQIKDLLLRQEVAAALTLVAGLASLAVYDDVVKIWIGLDKSVPIGLAVASLVKNYLIFFNSIYSYFLNGISKLWPQILLYGTMAALAYPSSYILNESFGLIGVVLYQPALLLVLALLQRRKAWSILHAKTAKQI